MHKNIIIKYFIFCLFFFLPILSSRGQLVSWDMTSSTYSGEVATFLTSKTNSNLDYNTLNNGTSKTKISVTSGQISTGSTNQLATSAWSSATQLVGDPIPTPSKYIEFIVVAKPGFRLSFSGTSNVVVGYNVGADATDKYSWSVFVNDKTTLESKSNFSSGLAYNTSSNVTFGLGLNGTYDKISARLHIIFSSASSKFSIIKGQLTTVGANVGAYITGTSVDVVNTSLPSSKTAYVGATTTFTSTGYSTDEVWLAPSGTVSFTDNGTTMTKASGTAGTITVPSTPGDYKLYVINTNATLGWTSAASTATVTVTPPPPTITFQNVSWGTSLNSNESQSDGTVNLQTTNVEDNQTATVTLNGSSYTGTILNGATSITIPTASLHSLFGSSYTLNASVSNLAGINASASNTFSVDMQAPTISVSTNNLSFGSVLNNSEKSTSATLTISTSGAENGQIVSVVLNSHTYTGTVSSNSSTITIPSADLSSLTDGANYSITTDLSDAAGNPAIQNSFSIAVDFTSPTLSVVSISSNNSNTTKAKENDVITLSLTASESIQTPTVTIAGQAATVTGAGGTYTATYTVVSSTIEGLATISVTYSDIAGNSGTTVSSTTNSSSVIVDRTAPTLTSVRISSNNANTAKAKENDVITLSLTASESIQLPSVTIAGQSATVTGTGGTYTATYTVSNTTTEGVAAISVNFNDLAGNAGTAVSSTTNSSTVTVDRTAPSGYDFTFLNTNVNAANQTNTTLNLSGAESGTTYIVNVISSTYSITGISVGNVGSATQAITGIDLTGFPDGTLTFELVLKDASGNIGSVVSHTTTKDAVVPTVSTVSTSLVNGSYKAGSFIPILVTFSEPVTVTGTPQLTLETGTNDAVVSYSSGSGTSTLIFNYTVGAGENTGDLNYVTTSALALNSGTIDDLGSNSATLTLPALNAGSSLGGSANIVIDTQTPTLTSVHILSNNANTTKAKENDVITLSLTASEAIQTPTVTIAGHSATVTGSGGTYTATYMVTNSTSEGTVTFTVNYQDLAGNTGTAVSSTTNTSTVTVDRTVPSLSSVLISSSNANTALAKIGDIITLSITASESINTPTISIAGGAASITGSGGTYTATYTVTSSTSQGPASITISFVDLAGNAGTVVSSTTNSSTVTVDRTAPTITIASNPANLRSGQTATLTFTISESVTDFIASDITISGGSIGTLSGTGTTYTAVFTPTPNSNANGVIDVGISKFTDAAGNTNTAASNTVTISIDNTLPTVVISSSTTALKAGETATITFTFSEAVQGFDLTDVTMNNGTFGTLTQTSSTVYTVVFTPATNLEGTSSISIGATAFTDLAGNDNGATASLSPLSIDTKIPSIGSISLSWGNTLNATESTSTGTISVPLTNVEDGRIVTVSINSQTYTGTVSANATTITIPSSRLSALTDGGTYTVTTNVSDAAGNAAPAGTLTFTVDKTLPTITSVITSAGTVINALEASSNVTLTVTTTGTENGQVVSVNLNSQTYTGTVSGNTASINIPASALTALTDGGTYTVTTNVSDAASNAANANSFTNTIDKTKPTTIITSNAANLKIGQSATLTITLSEVATDFVASNITVTGGTIGTLSGSGKNYTATFTPTANFEGTASLSIASATYTDPNANPNDESTNTANAISISVDTKAPTISITSNPANLRSGQSAVITFTISESVTDFVQSDVNVSGGTLSNWTAVSGTSYTADFTPTANSNANGVIDVAITKITDAAGNTNTAVSNTVTISIDNTVPTVTISSSTSALKVGETATITFTFSEAVLGFDLTDVTMNHGTFGTLTQTSSTVYEVVFTPATPYEGTAAISIGSSTFTDLAGNSNSASASAAPITIDTQVPTLSISNVSFGTSLNLSESASNGTISYVLSDVQAGQIVTTTLNSQTYTSTVASGGTSSVSIPSSALSALTNGGTYTITANVSDVAGNAAPAASATFTVDKTAPSLTAVSILSNNAVTNLARLGNTITLSITSSETISMPLVTIAGNSATVSGLGTSWTATYIATAITTEGIATISINYSDVAGNPGSALYGTTNSSTVKVDRTAPTMTISSSASTFKIGTTSTITFTASEPTTDFIQGDVTVTGGALSAWTAVSSTVYRATFTPNVNTAVNGNLSVTGAKFTDAAGNANGASNNVSFIIDTFRPTVALTSNVTSLNANQTATITFTFNESVTGFTASDIVATNGTIGALTGSGSVYSVVFTPAANFNGNASISVASNTFSDTIGNSNTDGADANNTFTVSIDASAPSVSSATIYSSNTDPTLGNIGDIVTIDFVTSETVNTPIVTMDGQTAYVSGDGINWTASYVIINSTNDGLLAFAIDYTDLAGNVGTTRTSTTDGTSVSVLKNQSPIDNSVPVTYSQDSPDFNLNLLAGITDPEGDPLTISNVTITYSIENVVTNQPVIINSTTVTKFQDVVSTADLSGTNLFIEMSKSKFLSGSQKGQINIAYVVTDGNNNLNANAVINIIGANDQPTGAAVTLNQVVINGQNMGIPLTEGVGVSTNVPGIDPDDDSVTYTLDQNSSVKNGQFVFNPDGSFNFLPDPNYYGEQEFDYYIKDQSGVLNGPYKVKIVIAENPDIDGIPSKLEEVAPNNGDVNGDGIPDRKQNNITNVPLGSYADFQAGIDWANGVPGAVKPSTSKVGSLLIGSLPGEKSGLGALDLDPNAKFRNVALLPTPNIANTDRQFSSDLYQFTIEGLLTNAADTLSPHLPLRDLDPNRPGLQVRAVLEFPVGMKGSTYLKKNAAGEWKSFKDDQNLTTYDDGATLIDLDNDPTTIERIVLTFTDGAFGDNDGLVNNTISDPGGLGVIKPVINDAVLVSRSEGTAKATLLYNVNDANSLTDKDDEGQKLYYTLDSTNSAMIKAAIAIDSLTGAITVKDADAFDFESFVNASGIAKFSFVVRAKDTDGNYDLATFTQEITNVDEYPKIISGKTVSYREKQPTSVAVIKVQTLPDYQDVTSFSILAGLDGSAFTIDPATGVLRFVKSPNFDDKAVYTLDIQSKDLSGKTDHAVFTVNIIDIDADNDGILDDDEIGPDPLHPIDTDKDGIPDYLDTDSDNDGIPDLIESTVDTDKDGIPDFRDLDSDGDGILDKVEAGSNPLKPADSDGDGVYDFRELDSDNDGYLDAYEKNIDTDKDGIPDFQDTDSDGDGILDKVEDNLDLGNLPDCDHDGIENRIDPDVCELILPQIITPNGDGLNDVLKIPGIFRLQPNHLTILNRWGSVVFEEDNYQNTWGGNGSSGELPDGTYYYVVDFKGAKPTITNFIYLDRTGK